MQTKRSCAEDSPRRHKSVTERQDIVAHSLRVADGGTITATLKRSVAKAYGITPKTLGNWLKDEHYLHPKQTSAEVPEDSELTRLAATGCRRTAWKTGDYPLSYPTYCRNLSIHVDPALVQAALHGRAGLWSHRAYLARKPSHVNHTWALDHTPADLYVWPSHRHTTAIRPHFTLVTDVRSALIHAVPWQSTPTTEDIAAALVEFGIKHDYHGVIIGGQPEVLVLDNASSHFAPVLTAGVERLGWVLAPIGQGQSFQNGSAESGVGLVNRRLCELAPGVINRGKTLRGRRRFVRETPADVLPHEVLPWGVFVELLQDTVDEINLEEGA